MIAHWRRLGNPKINLKPSIHIRAHFSSPVFDFFRRIRSAAQAPNPPARITAIEDDGGQAPAIGARRIGTRIPK
jgi:hypothetical protein